MQGLDVVDEVGSSIAAQRRRQARVDAEGYPARVAGVGVGEGHGNDGVVRVDGAQAQWGGPIGKILPVASDEMSGQIAAARGARGWGWGGRRSWPLCWRGGWCGRWRPTWAEERHIIDIHAALPIPSMHKDGEAGRGAAGDGDAKLRIAAAAGPGAAAPVRSQIGIVALHPGRKGIGGVWLDADRLGALRVIGTGRIELQRIIAAVYRAAHHHGSARVAGPALQIARLETGVGYQVAACWRGAGAGCTGRSWAGRVGSRGGWRVGSGWCGTPAWPRHREIICVDGALPIPAMNIDSHAGSAGASRKLHAQLGVACRRGGPGVAIVGAGAGHPNVGIVALHPGREGIGGTRLYTDRLGTLGII